ncbi:WbqC family protein [Paraburkholderia haematera]|jgi:WbqC-like protein family.|uniref:WbqC-like protein family protein n=1 Tax=Paraburkholderia haematera TaxID=2793077 RepID=A0ABM8RU25_9BURK|nr:WbqC family protein [Paraburkholderia haematera]CAE6771649.1 hypothetical protein R69888_03892 [Paraburkholderia haematera]
MKVAIMQPYFLPYIGYFQLIKAVDVFVVYDNIKYTKSGWFNRNRFLLNGEGVYFSVPIKKDSDYLNVVERKLAPEFDVDKLVNKLKAAYHRAPNFTQGFSILNESLLPNEANLFDFIKHSIDKVVERLEIKAKILVSSSIEIDHTLKAQDKVMAICRALGATTYINAIGGMELYSKEAFRQNGIDLGFIKSRPIEYRQFANDFVPWLSIIDVVMFNDIDVVKSMLDAYDVI